jgi:hypothetical protein
LKFAYLAVLWNTKYFKRKLNFKSVNLSILQKTINQTSKSPHAFAMCSISTYCKIRECYAVANAFMIRNMHSLLLYMKCNSRKINRPTKNMTKIVTLLSRLQFTSDESEIIPDYI